MLMRTNLEMLSPIGAGMGNLFFAIIQLSLLLIRTFPQVAVPTILMSIIGVYFDWISTGELAIAFAVFIVALFLWTIGSGLISKVRGQDFTRSTQVNALTSVFVLSLILSGFFISEIRSIPTPEQRMASSKEKRENEIIKNYSPSGVVAFITSTSEMTDFGRKQFYLNDPQIISTQSELNAICKTNTSHIDVSTLGCYSQRNNKIYLLDNDSGLTNNLLVGTAAHELLHSVYVNLPNEELRQVNAALLEVWNGPKHNYLAKRLSAYDFAERSSDHLNELHSIVGTEVENLPNVLAEHYAKYFNQSKVYKISYSYNKKVNGKKAVLANITKDLNSLKMKIELNKRQISVLKIELDSYKSRMSHYKTLSSSSNFYVSKYNELVPIFNETISKINDLNAETNDFINEYNSAVPKLNKNVQELKRLGNIEKS